MEVPKVIKELPPAPDDVQDWILKKVVRNTYIIYETKSKSAYCTRCQNHFSMYDLHCIASHNGYTKCPICGEEATFKSKGVGRKNLEEKTRVLTFARKGKSVYGVLTEIDISFEKEKPEIFTWMSAVYKFNNKDQLYYKHYPGWCYGSEEWKQHKNVKIPEAPYGGFYFQPKRQGLFVYSNNFNKVFPKSDFKYLDICNIYKEQSLSGNQLINLLNFSMKYPSVELLYKAGFKNIVLDKIADKPSSSEAVYWRGKELRKILRMNFGEIKEFRNQKIGLDELNKYQAYKKSGYKLSLEELEVACYAYDGTIDHLEKTLNIPHVKIIKYLAEQNYKNGEKVCNNRFSDYSDYIRDCIKMGLDIRRNKILFPENFDKAHMDLVEIVTTQRKAEIAKEAAMRKTKNDKDIKKYVKTFFKGKEIFTSGNLLIKPAMSTEELNIESSILGHCVKSYADRIANKTCLILFIRKLDDPDTPYYTLELSPKYIVIQCRGFKNCDATEEVKAFVEEWKQNVVEKLKIQSNRKNTKKVKAKAVA